MVRFEIEVRCQFNEHKLGQIIMYKCVRTVLHISGQFGKISSIAMDLSVCVCLYVCLSHC